MRRSLRLLERISWHWHPSQHQIPVFSLNGQSAVTTQAAYRFGSTLKSSTQLPTIQDGDDMLMEEAANRIIMSPIGSLYGNAWNDAEQALSYWIYQKHLGSNNNQRSPNDHTKGQNINQKAIDRGLRTCFDMLERLSREKVSHFNANPTDDLVLFWQHLFQNQQTNLKPLDVADRLKQIRSTGSVQPSSKSYTAIIDTAAGDNLKKDGVLLVDSLLKWMIDESKIHPDVRPNVMSFSSAMQAWAQSGRKEAVTKVEDLLIKMYKFHDEGWPDVEPNVVHCNILLSTYVRCGAMKKAEALFFRMMSRLEFGETSNSERVLDISIERAIVAPDQHSFTIMINALSGLRNPRAAEIAEHILARMNELADSGNEFIKPNVITYTAVIDCWSRIGHGERAELVLQQLIEKYRQSKDPSLKPDDVAYASVVSAWANANDLQRAESIIQRVQAETDFQPTIKMYNIMLSQQAKIGDAERAETYLQEIHHLHQSGHINSGLSTPSYNIVIHAWSKSKNPHKGQRALSILRYMERQLESGDKSKKPNSRTWNSVINCFAQNGQAGEAEKLLREYIEAYRKGRAEDPPNTRTWNTVLSACAKAGDSIRAKRIFDEMSETPADMPADPNTVSYNTLISSFALSRHPSAGEQAEEAFSLLENDPNVELDRTSCLNMINVWAAKDDPERAEAFLLRLLRQRLDGNDVPLDKGLFNRVLSIWSVAKSPARAEALLLKMFESHDEKIGLDINPQVESYNILLNCWARSAKSHAGERGEKILRHMQKLANSGYLETKPDIVTYNTVLNCWKQSGDLTAPSQIENLVLEMILKGDPSILPDNASYGTWVSSIMKYDRVNGKKWTQNILEHMKMHSMQPSDLVRNQMAKLLN